VRRVGSLILQMVPSDQLKITAFLECDEVSSRFIKNFQNSVKV
jgi:hypothetical protein